MRNLAHGQGLDLRKRIAQNLHLASGQKIDRRKGLPRQCARALTPPGQGRGLPLGAPSGCSRAASCGCSGHGLYLGIPARRGLQARDLLMQRCPRGFISSGSGPSSSGRLHRAAENRFRRRHVGDGHLVVTRHLLTCGGERERDVKQRRKKKGMWDLGARRLPFYRPVSLCGSCDFMTKKLMGASFMRAKPYPFTRRPRGSAKRNRFFFFL